MEKKKIIITAGGTSEAIDNVRKITNSSSGKLGMMIAEELLKREDSIDTLYYICSKTSLRPIHEKVKIIEIGGTLDLKEVVENLLTHEKIQYFIHSMAVSDYMVQYITTASLLVESLNEHENPLQAIKENTKILHDTKISSHEDNLMIMLKPTPKIISLIKNLSPKTYLVGFKLLDHVQKQELIEVATKLKDKNHCDLVVANDLADIKNGNHQAYIIDSDNQIMVANGKEEISKNLVRKMGFDSI